MAAVVVGLLVITMVACGVLVSVSRHHRSPDFQRQVHEWRRSSLHHITQAYETSEHMGRKTRRWVTQKKNRIARGAGDQPHHVQE